MPTEFFILLEWESMSKCEEKLPMTKFFQNKQKLSYLYVNYSYKKRYLSMRE